MSKMEEDLEPLASPNSEDLKQQNEKIEVLHEQYYIYTGNKNKIYNYLQQNMFYKHEGCDSPE